ncbi:sigma-54 interaction domain-containing protein [Pectinatus cerevisiiphilus]|uniref:Sigma-54 interacting transcriptional regulator n=1 Tax=Pectinatus cerevisiiphilus TaxID=86956 RepID=A0A4R3KDU7_9FIRM|nr:sigma 54-interacting transcriptional regulator [Pectinatus cerevisiiphilus]TCS81377.1 sigma-54 interacting transcriptional regulator [Pectinatus cerevisiiphilus]
MKTLMFIAMGINTTEACTQQLHKLLGARVNIISYSVNNGNIPSHLSADLIIFASHEAYIHAKSSCRGSTVLIARRAINYHEVDKLFALEAGTDVLLVNDLPDSTNRTIALLQTIGIDHINYHPCCPQMASYPHLKIAVTPGERELVPDFVENIIDIKTRLIDITTIVEMLSHLGFLHLYADFLSANYVQDIIRLSKKSYNIRNEIQQLKTMVSQKQTKKGNIAVYTFDKILGKSKVLSQVITRAQKMAKSNSPILIQGESGTGKELIAQSIHNASSYCKGPFVAVNFASLSESLLESELFGYVPGAFTGAKRDGAIGLFEEATHGTLFLDEIGDAPLSFQVKLLRALQEKQIRRVGGSRTIPINVRVIAATNQDLVKMINKGLFRKDLYYRLNVLPIEMPSLRDRGTDIMLLAKTFYQRQAMEHDTLIISPEFYFNSIIPYLLHYDWPGNIRELENTVEYLTTLSPDTSPGPELLPSKMQMPAVTQKSYQNENPYTAKALKERILEEIELANIKHTSIGRRSLAKKLCQPENHIRFFIEELKNEGRILSRRGRGGLLKK